MQTTPSGLIRIPEDLAEKVDSLAGSDKQKEWFYKYMECGDATAAVREVYNEPKYPSSQANYLMKKFRNLIVENVMIKRASIEPLALMVLEKALKVEHMVPLVGRGPDGESIIVTDPHGDPVMVTDSKILGVKVKAAAEVLDRGVMPKGMAIHGLSVNPDENNGVKSFKNLLDDLVRTFGGGWQGAAKVMEIESVKGRREYREYLEEKYPAPKVVEGVETPSGDQEE